METTVETKSTERHLYDDIDGFTDEDLEKPNFPGKQSSEKFPFILSDVDNPPIVQVPATINQYLREYQREGIAFLYRQYSCGKGAILADDMGLGKTVQVIGFISAVLGKTGTKMDIYGKFLSEHNTNKVSLNGVKKEKGTFLIVAPNSVLYNWHEELMTWGYFKLGKFHKNSRDETFQKAAAGKLDVVLTTYETLRNHWETLNRVKWLAIIMDEVQHLKDPKRAVTIASKSLNVKCRIGLTGTPLQNRLLDFWSVLDWANPGCLGDKEEFTYDFGRPIMQGQRFDGTKRELATGRKKSQEFQSMIDDWCLRRTKALIADQLPQKDQKVVFCPLSKLQEDMYKTLLQTNDVQLVLKQGEPCDCRSELTRGKCCYTVNEEGSNMKKLLLQCLRLFLKISNHVALLLPHVKQTDDQRKRAKAICEKVFMVHPEFEAASKSPSFELFSDSNFCGKMKVLDKLLKLFQQEKDKVLLFSYSTQLLDMLEAYVISCGMVYRRLDGKTRGELRLDVVREFNTNPSIFLFLVSTKAGGVGLNLTSANIVIVFDPSWNPADDLQAEDRAYRIGQRRDVKVFRLISSGSVEENMYLRQIYKQQLANVAVEGNNERRYFTAVDGEKDKKGELFGIENLFALGNNGCSVSTDIFKRSAKVERGFQMTKYELQPKEDTEHKMHGEQTTSPPLLITEAEEENSYNLDEITSQFYDDETAHKDCLPNRSAETLNHVEESNNAEEGNGKLKTYFNKVLDISHEIEKLNKSLSPSCGIERQKRQKIKQGASPSKRRPISKDSQVNQILEECGVQHTHSNKMIIGASEAENEMTSRAMKEVFDLGQYSQHPANCFAAVESDGEESDDIGDYTEQESNTKTEINDLKKPENDVFPVSNRVQRKLSAQKKADGCLILFGETPKTIRFRQFTEISKAQGYKSEVEFARAVVSGSTTARLRMLMEYYKKKGYPDESIESFSEAISQELNTSKNSKENEEFTKMKGLVNQTRHLKKSTRQKSSTKVLKSPIVKPNKSNRLVKKRSKHLQATAESNANQGSEVSKTKQQHQNERMGTFERSKLKDKATVPLQSNADKSPNRIVDNLEHKNDQKQVMVGINEIESNLDMSERESGNKLQSIRSDYEECTKTGDKAFVKALSSAVSPANADNVSEDIFDDILTECINAKCSKSDSTPDSKRPSNTPLVSTCQDDSQSSSFLDEFLLECSLRTHNGTEIGLSQHERRSNEKRLVEKTTRFEKMQTSIIDDLI